MAELFRDIPEAISNTVAVADKCKLHSISRPSTTRCFTPPHLEGKKVRRRRRGETEVDRIFMEALRRGH